jgi:hypothetical protein
MAKKKRSSSIKTLIFTDIHNHWEWVEGVINREAPDQIVFAGDYFDGKNEEPSEISDVADWFHWSINQPNRIMCCGNHEPQYRYPYPHLQVNTFTQTRKFIISEFVTADDWNKLKYYHVLDGTWLITHAGLHPHYLPVAAKESSDRKAMLQAITNDLDCSINQIDSQFAKQEIPSIFNVGYSRKGWAKYGHILWCDFNREFQPVKGLNQLFGHTPQSCPTWAIVIGNGSATDRLDYMEVSPTKADLDKADNSFNLCLDSKDKRYYALWDGKKLAVKHAGNN